jgi:hypothetical protein
MLPRTFAIALAITSLLCAACGGGAPRSATADLAAIRQPTPDPTLDAVVRDLPRALAGVLAAPPTPTPTPPAIISAPVQKPKPTVPAPTVRPVPAPTVRPIPRATAVPSTVSKPRP